MSLPLDVRERLNLIVYENGASFEQSSNPNFQFTNEFASFEYVISKVNGGVTPAYNYALRKASQLQIDWLLLLDQDTELSLQYFNEAFHFLSHNNRAAIAFIPRIAENNRVFTPVSGILKRPTNLSGNVFIDKTNFLNSISSGLLLSVAYMLSLGGFESRFWLDGLDHWLFCVMLKQNSPIFIGNSILEHNLSVNSKNYVSFARYVNILDSEKLLYLEYWMFKQKIVYLLMLLYRIFKLAIKTQQLKYSIRTLKQFFCCLFL
jgi:GT2 family glycosyltransferase